MSSGWVGVDFDGTLCHYVRQKYRRGHCGEPIVPMVNRVKKWLAEGKTVKIFTARCWPFTNIDANADPVAMLAAASKAGGETQARAEEAMENCLAIRTWCAEHFGQILPITCVKDYDCDAIWDDRAIQVEHNTGRRMDGAE